MPQTSQRTAQMSDVVWRPRALVPISKSASSSCALQLIGAVFLAPGSRGSSSSSHIRKLDRSAGNKLHHTAANVTGSGTRTPVASERVMPSLRATRREHNCTHAHQAAGRLAQLICRLPVCPPVLCWQRSRQNDRERRNWGYCFARLVGELHRAG